MIYVSRTCKVLRGLKGLQGHIRWYDDKVQRYSWKSLKRLTLGGGWAFQGKEILCGNEVSGLVRSSDKSSLRGLQNIQGRRRDGTMKRIWARL